MSESESQIVDQIVAVCPVCGRRFAALSSTRPETEPVEVICSRRCATRYYERGPVRKENER